VTRVSFDWNSSAAGKIAVLAFADVSRSLPRGGRAA